MTDLWYLAGRMTGLPHFNYPTFDRAAGSLRNAGYNIVSPAEMDDPTTRAAAMASVDGSPASMPPGESWGDFLARDVKLISDKVDGIIFLPEWEKSRGARLEAFVGLLTDKRFAFYCPGGHIFETSTLVIRGILQEHMP